MKTEKENKIFDSIMQKLFEIIEDSSIGKTNGCIYRVCQFCLLNFTTIHLACCSFEVASFHRLIPNRRMVLNAEEKHWKGSSIQRAKQNRSKKYILVNATHMESRKSVTAVM